MTNILDNLFFRAKCQPDNIAIQSVDGAITFRQLQSIVKKLANKFRQLGFQSGQLAITCLPDKQLDWIVTLALAHEALASCSNHGYAPINSDLGVDWVITDKVLSTSVHNQTLLIDAEFIKAVERESEAIESKKFSSRDSLFRLVLTSGTTGTSNGVAFTQKDMLERCQKTSKLWAECTHELCLMSLSTMGGYYVAMCNLLVGVPLYIAASPRNQITLIAANKIQCLSGSPNQLALLVEQLDVLSVRLTSLMYVWYAGGAIPERLLRHIQSKLCTNVACYYGSTEVGGVSTYLTHNVKNHAVLAGYAAPGVEIQVVDDHDESLPMNTEGLIRLKSQQMIHSYYKNPHASARSFKEGWFYPGDRGHLQADGLLVLAGRDSELINKGGVKVNPVPIEQFIVDFEGVKDAAVFGLENAMGIQDVAVALVISDEFNVKELQFSLVEKFGRSRVPTQYFRVKKVARNEMGKVQRSLLSESFKKRMHENPKQGDI